MHFKICSPAEKRRPYGRPCGRCSLCGCELLRGERGWYLNGQSVCADCFPAFARAELAPCETVFGMEGGSVTLYQISFTYRADAAVLRTRISELRAAARAAQDREEAERLKRRIAELQVLRRQSSELAELTKRYYERNYHRDERYTL